MGEHQVGEGVGAERDEDNGDQDDNEDHAWATEHSSRHTPYAVRSTTKWQTILLGCGRHTECACYFSCTATHGFVPVVAASSSAGASSVTGATNFRAAGRWTTMR